MEEIWIDVKDYIGYYQVSNLGRVKSLIRKRCLIEKILKPAIGTTGYPYVNLANGVIRKKFKVHRLVAEAFITNSEGKSDVNHINGIKTDNNLINLEWNTRSENIQHAYDNGLNYNNPSYGIKHHKTTLSEDDVINIYKEEHNRKTNSYNKIAMKYNTTKRVIYSIKNKETWKEITNKIK